MHAAVTTPANVTGRLLAAKAVSNPITANTSAPSVPADAPNAGPLLASVRRGSPIAAVNNVAGSALTVDPVVALTDDVITGSAGAVDSKGYPLGYTLARSPNQGGYVLLDNATGNFEYVPNAKLVSSKGTEQFSVLVSETTPFDTALAQLPVLGSLAPQILAALHQLPMVGSLLAPLIGAAVTEPINVDIGAVVPDGAPVARTITVTSFDGTTINAHFYPASGLATGQTAPTIFNGAGLGSAGDTDPNAGWGADPWNSFKGDAPQRQDGYNVLTWDSRGEFGSGGAR